MRFFFISILLASTILFSCKKDNGCSYTETVTIAPSTEVNYLQNYITANSIVAMQHSSGFFYSVDNNGTGKTPSVCSSITVTYTGSLLSNGSVFETKTNVSFALGELIKGWQQGLPIIKGGGIITLYIPPSLGYGSADVVENGMVAVPANSYLKFVINLSDVQ